ncbi:Hypothetical protein CINCED_3A024530 [Cinara cedri]|uniref:Uncharacterized protein n=1 Tax=Cinara cedri TaxID=506608 RepID=A0A5E4N8E1_9HEMI|nr:Hypothetical protein CINCED_3A024530 [Cinara cedri]
MSPSTTTSPTTTEIPLSVTTGFLSPYIKSFSARGPSEHHPVTASLITSTNLQAEDSDIAHIGNTVVRNVRCHRLRSALINVRGMIAGLQI